MTDAIYTNVSGYDRLPSGTDRLHLDLDLDRFHELLTALDDYGTGYSSLANVAALPVDELKIDITVVAEGVENADQAFALRALGCEYGQGFHFGRPTPEPALVSSTVARTS
jgi:EAL domain-containing protein (putative c-di-GMP-specific phosphodiesterase class I)